MRELPQPVSTRYSRLDKALSDITHIDLQCLQECLDMSGD